jgi:uracil-DNA glycosylase family 4
MMNAIPQVSATLQVIRQSLEYFRGSGMSGYDCSPEVRRLMDTWHRPLSPRRETLDTIREDLGDCRRCPLCRQRRHIVFGVGNPRARIVFVGEGPGQEEDHQGEPFVGAAGQLLTRILQAMRLSRTDVYIANVVKCRPPKNRNPEAHEIATCLPFLERQIRAIQPDFICALGTVAAQTLLASDQPISRLRGHFHDYHGIRLLPTFHPAYLLRNPEKKREVWEDMKLLMREHGDAR